MHGWRTTTVLVERLARPLDLETSYCCWDQLKPAIFQWSPCVQSPCTACLKAADSGASTVGSQWLVIITSLFTRACLWFTTGLKFDSTYSPMVMVVYNDSSVDDCSSHSIRLIVRWLWQYIVAAPLMTVCCMYAEHPSNMQVHLRDGMALVLRTWCS